MNNKFGSSYTFVKIVNNIQITQRNSLKNFNTKYSTTNKNISSKS